MGKWGMGKMGKWGNGILSTNGDRIIIWTYMGVLWAYNQHQWYHNTNYEPKINNLGYKGRNLVLNKTKWTTSKGFGNFGHDYRGKEMI